MRSLVSVTRAIVAEVQPAAFSATALRRHVPFGGPAPVRRFLPNLTQPTDPGTDSTVMCHIAMLEAAGEGDRTTRLGPVTDEDDARAHRIYTSESMDRMPAARTTAPGVTAAAKEVSTPADEPTRHQAGRR